MSRRVAVSGSTGLIGSALVDALRGDGVTVHPLVRSREKLRDGDLLFSPDSGEIDAAGLEGVDAVVHLAGEPIASSRWSEAQKRRIMDSRVDGTGLLARTLARLSSPPEVMVSASAIGFYGDRDDELLTEASSAGEGFLVDVVEAWEAAAAPAVAAGIRVVHPRTGIVLTPDGGALEKMLIPFKLGVGGRIGSGQQWMSWISLTDEIRALRFLLDDTSLRGPVNLTAPTPVTNIEFTKALGDVLNRPTVFPVPGFALKLLLGEMGEALTLDSARIVPTALTDAGFAFTHTDVTAALRAEID